MGILGRTQKWFELAVPVEKFETDFALECQQETQYQCVLEEVEELKQAVLEDNNIETLDALCDVIVTCVGLAYLKGFDIRGAMEEVNRSNFSKFDDEGKPIFRDDGKILKHSNYTKPELEDFISL